MHFKEEKAIIIKNGKPVLLAIKRRVHTRLLQLKMPANYLTSFHFPHFGDL